MSDIREWTLNDFNEHKKELLIKDTRRKEIGNLIKTKKDEQINCNRIIAENEQQIEKLILQINEASNQISRMKEGLSNSYKGGTGEFQNNIYQYQNNLVMRIATQECELKKMEDERDICKISINENKEKKRVLELEMQDLKKEDNEIILFCKSEAQEMYNLSLAANHLKRTHQSVSVQTSEIGGHNYGHNQINNLINTTNDSIVKYSDMEKLAVYISRLALSIIQDSSSTEGGGEITEYNVLHNSNNIMNIGQGSYSSQNNVGCESSQRSVSSDDLSLVSILQCKYNESMETRDLDLYYGESVYNVSYEEFSDWRKKEGYIWHVEGDRVYLMKKDSSNYQGLKGFDLEEWDNSNVKVLRKC